MEEPRAADHVTETDAPAGRPVDVLDARELPPPRPLRDTLERLEEVGEETVLVQVNDRVPRHLFPALSDRGYVHDTVETETGVVTAVWRE